MRRDEGFDFGDEAWTSRVGAMLRSVEFAGDQTTIPGKDCFRFRNRGDFGETLPAKPFTDFGERRALGVGKWHSSGDVRAKDSILRKEVFALQEQALIDHAGHVCPQPCPSCCSACQINMVAVEKPVIGVEYFNQSHNRRNQRRRDRRPSRSLPKTAL